MRKSTHHKHFLSYTLEHLFGAAFIVVLSVGLGYVAQAQSTAGGSASASTTLTVMLDTPPASAPKSAAESTSTGAGNNGNGGGDHQVSFGATAAPITDCLTGKPLTEVFLVISDPSGGSFQISSDNGMSNAPMEWGRVSLGNGRYSWKAIPANGYTVTGEDTGAFVLSGECLASSGAGKDGASASSTPIPASGGGSAGTFPLQYPENSVTPTVAVGSTKIKQGDSVSGGVNFDVVVKGMTRSIFVIESPKTGKQFIDKKLGVMHKDGSDEWSVEWNTKNTPDGDYSLAALMDNSAGTTFISKRFAFSVHNNSGQENAPGVVTTSALVMPTIKIFVDNNPVSPGALVFSDETVEMRVSAASAKKITFYASIAGKSAPLELGAGVIDDLLSSRSVDVWTLSWNTKKADQDSYKLFARVLNLDGTVVESAPMLLRVDRTPAGVKGANPNGDASTTAGDEMSIAQKEEILARVTSPALCGSVLECKVYCKDASLNDLSCRSYAQGQQKNNIPLVSLTDGISTERLTDMLTDPKKRLKYLPEAVRGAEDLREYCADPSHSDICTKALVVNDLAAADSLAEKKKLLIQSRDDEKALLTERIGARAFIDSDKDGITDYDEVNITHTDPNDADTDHDGFPDGAELLVHTNPNGQNTRDADASGGSHDASSTLPKVRTASESVTLEDPLIAGVTQKDLLAVDNVVAQEVGFDAHGTSTAKKLTFSGTAPANSFVTLYIFSDPIVVTIKADASGKWNYTLGKELPNGSHQVLSAITNEQGHILAKSEALPFVKQAAAVSVGANALRPVKTPLFSGTSLYAMIAILIGLLGIGFSAMGFLVHRRAPLNSDILFPNAKDK